MLNGGLEAGGAALLKSLGGFLSEASKQQSRKNTSVEQSKFSLSYHSFPSTRDSSLELWLGFSIPISSGNPKSVSTKTKIYWEFRCKSNASLMVHLFLLFI